MARFPPASYPPVAWSGNAAQPAFIAPLTTSIIPLRAMGSPTFTRATTATVTDWESAIRNVLSGEARFKGARRVQNLFTSTTTLSTQGVTTIAGTYTISFTGTGTITFTGTFTGSLVGQGATTRVSATITTTAGTLTCTVSGSVTSAQCENVSGQSNQNPAEYVSVGVLSSPYQGAGVDGVQYFNYQNGNTVSSNVVTAAKGATISSSTLLGYLSEEARTNLVLQSSNFGTTWAAIGTPSRVSANDRCGDITLDLLGDADAGTLDGYSQTVTFTGNAQKSVSFLIKQGTSTSSVVRLRDTTASADRLLLAITWSGGAPVSTYTTGSEERAAAPLANGVYRIHALTTSVTAANTNSLQVYPATTAALAIANTGNASFGGMQAEDATFADSLIPTTTATVSRNTDVLTYPVSGNGTAATGTAYCEIASVSIGVAQAIGLGSATNAANRQINRLSTTTQITSFDGVNTVGTNVSAMTSGVAQKVASTWTGSTLKATANGTAPASATYNGDIFGGLPNFMIGGFQGGGTSCTVRNVQILQRALTSANMQTLTT